MSDTSNAGAQAVFDRSVKVLGQDFPDVVCRLAGTSVMPSWVQRDDSAINLPELRADHFFRIRKPKRSKWGLHLEAALGERR